MKRPAWLLFVALLLGVASPARAAIAHRFAMANWSFFGQEQTTGFWVDSQGQLWRADGAGALWQNMGRPGETIWIVGGVSCPRGWAEAWVVGGDGNVYIAYFDHIWQWAPAFTPPSGPATGSPSATAYQGYLGGVVRTENGHINELYWDGGAWQWFDHGIHPGGQPSGDPSFVENPGVDQVAVSFLGPSSKLLIQEWPVNRAQHVSTTLRGPNELPFLGGPGMYHTGPNLGGLISVGPSTAPKVYAFWKDAVNNPNNNGWDWAELGALPCVPSGDFSTTWTNQGFIEGFTACANGVASFLWDPNLVGWFQTWEALPLGQAADTTPGPSAFVSDGGNVLRAAVHSTTGEAWDYRRVAQWNAWTSISN